MELPQRDRSEALTTMHVRRAMAGDAHSLGWLVERLSPLLLSQAKQRLGPHLRKLYDPEDIVQEAWAVALPRLADLPSRDGRYTPVVLKFLSTTILYRISNLMQKHLSQAQVQAAASEDLSSVMSGLPADVTRQISRAIRSEASRLVLDALQELPEEDHRLVVLRGIEENSVQEVAVMMGLLPNTVSVRYRRVLERLRARLPRSVFDELEE